MPEIVDEKMTAMQMLPYVVLTLECAYGIILFAS
jgi:hypothetical protein